MALKLKDIVRGTTRAIDTTWRQANGSAYDLAGATVRFVATLQEEPTSDSSAAINVSTSSHTDPTNGQSRIILTPSDTNVAPNTYNVGIQATLLSGEVVEKTGIVNVVQDYAKTSP